jgi:hypothetical protein
MSVAAMVCPLNRAVIHLRFRNASTSESTMLKRIVVPSGK